jgi:hypothetical protein
MRLIGLSFLALLALAPAACGQASLERRAPEKNGSVAEAETFSSETADVGKIAYGKTSAEIAYVNPMRYRALKLTGRAGDPVDIWIRSADGDAMGWLVDDAYNVVAQNDDADGTTMDSHLAATLPATASGVFRILFREFGLAPAHFTVHVDGPLEGTDGGAPAPDASGPDASAPDTSPAGDAAPPPDASPLDPGTVVCGGVVCHAGQTCTANGCIYPCDGLHVPGDYPSIKTAVSALSGIGGTICLEPTRYYEDVPVTLFGKSLTIVGAGPELSSISSLRVDGTGTFELRGTTVRQGSSVTVNTPGALSVRFKSSRIIASYGAFNVTRYGANPASVDFDACEFVNTNRAGAGIYVTDVGAVSSSPLSVTVTSSYIHGGETGVVLTSSQTVRTTAQLRLVNNTFADNNYGIKLVPGAAGASLDLFNNLFVGNDVGVTFPSTPAIAVQHGSNGFTNNGASYSGAAVPGPGNVSTNVLLDTSAPPFPLAGSSLIGAASTAAPSRDFFGAFRSPADIGAVQHGTVPGPFPPPRQAALPAGTFTVVGMPFMGLAGRTSVRLQLTTGPLEATVDAGVPTKLARVAPDTFEGAYAPSIGYTYRRVVLTKDPIGPRWSVFIQNDYEQFPGTHVVERNQFLGWFTP